MVLHSKVCLWKRNPTQARSLSRLTPSGSKPPSRYPVHRLARKGSIKIEVSEKNDLREASLGNGKSATTAITASLVPWLTQFDTLIINRRIEEAPPANSTA